MDQAARQEQCELGQRQLMDMDYLAAEDTLAAAERQAWADRDFDSLARLYMPLQEARRQRRQRCGEGPIRQVILSSTGAAACLEEFRHGILIAAGMGSLAPAIELRRLAARQRLYVDVFLSAAYPRDEKTVIVIAPLPTSSMPAPLANLRSSLPPHCIILNPDELAQIKTYSDTMSLWERLHAPYLAIADALADDHIHQVENYRLAIEVDYACELAHQNISDIARRMARGQ